LLLFGIAAYILQFIIFKMYYWGASYCIDSVEYLLQAHWNNEAYTLRSVGYSKFLWIFSLFSHSDLLIVTVQYVFVQLAGLFFLFTIYFCFQSGKIVKMVLAAFFICNPAPLYLANYILSDCIFMGLSLLWFAVLIRMIHHVESWQKYIVCILLLCLLALRYNAFYYPIITLLAVLFSSQRWPRKLIGIVVNWSLPVLFVIYVINKEYHKTGTRQFEPFSGWVLANNALIMYQHVADAKNEDVPERFLQLHKTVRAFMDTARIMQFRKSSSDIDPFYMWNTASPLRKYAESNWREKKQFDFYKAFHMQGVFYEQYGLNLIRKYPLLYLRYYVWPNGLLYCAPDLERLGFYIHTPANMSANIKGIDSPDSLMALLKSSENVDVLKWYPYFGFIINGLTLFMILEFLIYRDAAIGLKSHRNILWLMIFFWLANMVFSICASPVYLRFQIFPITIFFTFCLVTAELLHWRNREQS